MSLSPTRVAASYLSAGLPAPRFQFVHVGQRFEIHDQGKVVKVYKAKGGFDNTLWTFVGNLVGRLNREWDVSAPDDPPLLKNLPDEVESLSHPPALPYNFHLIAKGYAENLDNPKLSDAYKRVNLLNLLTMLVPQVEYFSDTANGNALEQVVNRIP